MCVYVCYIYNILCVVWLYVVLTAQQALVLQSVVFVVAVAVIKSLVTLTGENINIICIFVLCCVKKYMYFGAAVCYAVAVIMRLTSV